MKDQEYQRRFTNCLINHYRNQYEMHMYTDVEELKASNPKTYSSLIMDEYTMEGMTNFVEEGLKLLCLTEEEVVEKYAGEHIIYTQKYQEVYKITEILQQLTAGDIGKKDNITGLRLTGVYSFTKEVFQIPVAALLAELYGESQRVLLIDLQPFSGFTDSEIMESHMGLEDILSSTKGGNYSKRRLLACIGHASNWDYVYPVRNTECLAEGSCKDYKNILEIMEQELSYERVIINFGTAFPEWMNLLSECEDIYLLKGKEMSKSGRERVFCDEVKEKGKDTLFQNIKYLEVAGSFPSDESWQSLLEKFRYGFLGESLRQTIGQGDANGKFM